MNTRSTCGWLGFWIAHFNVLAICGVLLGGFVVQFGWGEFPCPLCMLQRMAMMLAALGPAYIIARARHGEVTVSDMATGYGMSVVAAVFGGIVSARQILLHIVPPDAGFGSAVLGLHLYTWALLVFAVVLIDAGVNLIFAETLAPRTVHFGRLSRLTLGILTVIIVTNLVTVFFLEGFHLLLPDSPNGYRLIDDLGLK